MTRILIYQLGLNGVWFACVFGASWGLPWLGPAAALPWLAWYASQQASAAAAALRVLGAGAFGVAADLVLIRLGGLEYAGLPGDALLGPAWIVALWMVFSTTVDVTLGWLHGRFGLAAALGVAGGIASYVGGRRLGVVSFDLTQPETLLALVGVWGIGVPLLLHAAELQNALRSGVDQVVRTAGARRTPRSLQPVRAVRDLATPSMGLARISIRGRIVSR